MAPPPDINGHDMRPVPDSPHLILATAAHPWLFDRDTRQFATHPRLGDAARVKSVHVDPASKRLLWVQGAGTVWWSEVVRLVPRAPRPQIVWARSSSLTPPRLCNACCLPSAC